MKVYRPVVPAKVNLYLEIIGDRPDGFHELATIFQSIDLHDRVTVRSAPSGIIRVRCDHPDVPEDATNLAYRAAALMAERFPAAFSKYGGVDLEIEKRVPVAAGLAGGSANGVAALAGVDLLWELGLTRADLCDLAAELGSDLPFCVLGGTALATGRGELLDPLPDVQGVWTVLGKYRSIGVSTPWAYKTYRDRFGAEYARTAAELKARRQAAKSGEMVQAIARLSKGDRDALPVLAALMRNDFEKVVLPEYPAIATLRDTLAEAAPLGAMMSGSGPTVFALAPSHDEAEAIRDRAQSRLGDQDLDFWIAPFRCSGIGLDPA